MRKPIRNTIFCELPAIEQIISDYWEIRRNFDSNEEYLLSVHYWYSLLSKYSELIIDIEKSDFEELALINPIYNRLLKDSQSGGQRIQYWKNLLTELESDNRFEDFPNALFLLNQTETYCNQKINDYGLIFINGKNYKSFTNILFLLTDVQVKTNKKMSDVNSWTDFKRLAHPINSLILTDNYILKDREDIATNLIPLLDALLPVKLNKCKFQLMIITQEMEQSIFAARYFEVFNQLNKLNRNYEIEFSLITTSIGKNHDRRIFTNYCLLESNNSFTYFNKQGNIKKNTTLHIFPSFMIASGPEVMLKKNLNTLAEIKEIVDNARQNKELGSNIPNRLLSLIPS